MMTKETVVLLSVLTLRNFDSMLLVSVGKKKISGHYRSDALETAVISFRRVTLLCLCVQKMFVASPYTDPVIAPDSDPQPLDAGDGLIWVVGPVLAVVFIICIVIAILLYKK